jgi:hypothetical protein
METWAPLAWDDLKADEDEHMIASFSTFPFDSILVESCGSVVQDDAMLLLHDEEGREVVQLATLFCFWSLYPYVASGRIDHHHHLLLPLSRPLVDL